MMLNTRVIRDYMSVNEMINADTKIWGNKFSFLHIELPKLINGGFSNPLDFVYKTRKQIKRYRNSPVVYLTAQCLEIIRKYKGSEVHETITFLYQNIVFLRFLLITLKKSCRPGPGTKLWAWAESAPYFLEKALQSTLNLLKIDLGPMTHHGPI